jgi:hypothetical protein
MHDACFLPCSCHVDGNVQCNEMAWAGDGNRFVNIRCSCLMLDRNRSFVSRWRPPCVSALTPEDRCHLNGLGTHEGRSRYGTALEAIDAPARWLTKKARGGVLISVSRNKKEAGSLSMRHSPRRFAGRLWLRESGAVTFGVVDAATARCGPIATLPGFTRGLDFSGRFAFIGLWRRMSGAPGRGRRVRVLDSVAQTANYLSDVNDVGSQQFKHTAGTAVSNVMLTTATSTTANSGINLDILYQGSGARNGIANVSVNAGQSDTSGSMGPKVNVPVTIVAIDPDESVRGPVTIQFSLALNVKTFASNNAAADLTYAASYTHDGTTTSLASKCRARELGLGASSSREGVAIRVGLSPM